MHNLIIGVLLVSVGIVAGVYGDRLFEGEKNVSATAVSADAARSGEKKILYWVAPMDPNYRRDKPGKSPMGMDLIPVYEGQGKESGDDTSIVRIRPEVVNNLGVRTARVVPGDLGREINTVGYLNYDETMINHVHTRTEGWIEKLLVRAEGDHVKQGELLFELYSPTLVNAQEEYVQALAGGNARLKKASRDRLVALDIPESQIRQLEKDRDVSQYVKFYAPRTGVLINLKVREGMYVMPSNEVMAIASLDHVWLLAEVFERQANWVRSGQTAEATMPSMPGKVWQGKVDYVYPDLDARTRTLRVRLRFENPDEVLKPNMFAHVVINGDTERDVLSIPSEALIREAHSQHVILALGEGRFKVRDVVAGIESGDRVEIKSGLAEGDDIVTSAQFLLDSESSFKAGMQRMEPVAQNSETTAAPAAEIMAMGTVKKVMADEHRLNITHDPIKQLGWPSMTMDFTVKNNVDLSAVKTGERIHFNLQKDGDNYVITSIHAMQSMTQAGGQMTMDNGIMAMGTVKKVMADEHRLNITHEPIKELGWPTMTMDFMVKDNVDLSAVKTGERIHFSLEKADDGNYVITGIHAMDSMQ